MSNHIEQLDPETQADLLDGSPLPKGWVLRAQNVPGEAKRYYALVPGTAVSTTAHLDPERVPPLAHEKHQKYINKHGEPPTPEAEAREAEQALSTPEPDVPERVYDEEKDDWVAIDPEGRDLYDFVTGFVQVSTIVRGLAFRAIREHKYYLHGGFSNFREYCESAAPVGRRTVYRDIKRAEQFSDFMPDVFAPEQVKQALDAGRSPFDLLRSSDDEVPKQLTGLSAGKVDLIGGLPDEQKRRYMEEGVIELSSGDEITVEDIRAETVKELQAKFEKKRKAQKRKLEEMEERALKAEAEKEALEQQIEQERERIEEAQSLHDEFGGKANLLREKRRLMKEVNECLDEALRKLPKVGITPEDPEADQEALIETLRRIKRLEDVFNADYGDVRMNLGL